MTSWPRGIAWSAAATLAAMGSMFGARTVFQIRTLPERVLEWLLLFVPLEAFEKGLQSFGPKAKVLTLYGGVAVMAAVLLGLGVLALHRRWSEVALLGMALLLYLVVMAGIMPLTGAGAFGTALLQHPLLVNGAYLATSLVYATVLLAARVLEAPRAARPGATAPTAPAGSRATDDRFYPWRLGSGATAPTAPAGSWARGPSRRALAIGVASTLGAYALTIRQGVVGAMVGSDLPLAQLPAELQPGASATPDTPAAEAPSPEAPAAPEASAPPAPEATATPEAGEAAAAPSPELERQLARDQDGVLTAAARAKGELAPLVTPVRGHYVVTKNPVSDPVLDAATWRLVIDGEVQQPVQLDYQTLRRLPPVELYKTLECISNFTADCQLAVFGCDLISTAQWKGARLRDVLALAGGLKPSAISLQIQGADEYSSAIPPQLALDPDTLLVYEMNGQVLPHQHGHPARLLVPGRYGFKSAKWVVGIRAQRTEHVDWYGQRNWNRIGLVKTMSRIDVPAPGALLPAGRQRIAGVAYAGDRGVGAVQFSSDGGRTWNPTVFLEAPLGRDAWRRWEAEFDVNPGQRLRLTCRAIDATGQVQLSTFKLPQPNGASGWHTIDVTGMA